MIVIRGLQLCEQNVNNKRMQESSECIVYIKDRKLGLYKLHSNNSADLPNNGHARNLIPYIRYA